MPKRKRRNHSPAFKAKVALAAGPRRAYGGRPSPAVRCAPESDSGVEEEAGAGGRACRARDPTAPRQDWATADGEVFFIEDARSRPMNERRAMIHGAHPLPVTRRCALVGLAPVDGVLPSHGDLTERPAANAADERDPPRVPVLRASASARPPETWRRFH
jgi:hypothetical protein